MLVGRLPATRTWERADQDLLELFASEIAVGDPERPAVRAGRGPERPAARARRGQGRLPPRRQPQPPDAADEHPGLRRPARRPIDPTGGSASSSEQSERLSRMVRQLLTVTRLESGALHPRAEVVALAHPCPQGLGGARGRRRDVQASRTARAAGWPSPTPTSSTRSSGRCSTTRSSTADGSPISRRASASTSPASACA